MTTHARSRSLRTELLLKLAVLLAAALLLPVCSLSISTLRPEEHPVAFAVAMAAEIILVVTGVALLVRTAVLEPLSRLTRAAADIAHGELTRRVPPTARQELDALGAAFDRLTSRVVADQAHLVRVEKLASIGRLSATVAHEIGNPLGAMLGHVHQLRQRLLRRAAPTEDLELLAEVERESTRIERIVRGLLDYARGRPPQPVAVDIEEVIRSSVEHCRSQGELKAVDVLVELTGAPVHVSGQRPELEQLFINLLTNGVDAMNGRGQVVVRLERAARFTLREPASRRLPPDDEKVIEHPPSSHAQRWLAGNDAAEIAKIVVADSGPGVPAALTERIFDPFFTTKPPGKGSGLGLAIVARIVENCHGAIWVTTAREGGAAFHILFPMVPARVDESPRSRPTWRRRTPPLSHPRTRQP